MLEMEMFLKENKIKIDNRFFSATKSLIDKEGNPLQWEIRPLSTRENEEIRQSCLVKGSDGYSLNTPLYVARMVAASVVEPNLYNAKLQDSYGVKCPEDLVREMVDLPSEYSKLVEFVEDLNGFTSMEDKVNQAKN